MSNTIFLKTFFMHSELQIKYIRFLKTNFTLLFSPKRQISFQLFNRCLFVTLLKNVRVFCLNI